MQLNDDDAYGMACGLTLADGRKITLTRLQQSMTYEGLLEGYPTRKENERRVAALVESERTRTRCPPIIIEPTRRASFHRAGPVEDAVRDRVPEWLPMVACVANFTSLPTGRDQDAHMSELSVVWFQDQFALPFAAEALAAIRAIALLLHQHRARPRELRLPDADIHRPPVQLRLVLRVRGPLGPAGRRPTPHRSRRTPDLEAARAAEPAPRSVEASRRRSGATTGRPAARGRGSARPLLRELLQQGDPSATPG
jgi:hypothetical protein